MCAVEIKISDKANLNKRNQVMLSQCKYVPIYIDIYIKIVNGLPKVGLSAVPYGQSASFCKKIHINI